MTNEEAIIKINTLRNEYNDRYIDYCGVNEAVNMAIKALRVVGRIKEIINISNFVIQEDVLKYKMICEVVEKMGGGEND